MQHVPTVVELVAAGLAFPVQWTGAGAPMRYRITPEGHALLGSVMRGNGLEARASGAADWAQPPSTGHPREAEHE